MKHTLPEGCCRESASAHSRSLRWVSSTRCTAAAWRGSQIWGVSALSRPRCKPSELNPTPLAQALPRQDASAYAQHRKPRLVIPGGPVARCMPSKSNPTPLVLARGRACSQSNQKNMRGWGSTWRCFGERPHPRILTDCEPAHLGMCASSRAWCMPSELTPLPWARPCHHACL